MLYGNGRSVVIRDLDDPTKATTFTEHKGKVMVAQFSPNGEWVASGGMSLTLHHHTDLAPTG
jgi:WD40 repeat protein